MAATVALSESNGAGETPSDSITNMNFGSADMAMLVAANHPIRHSLPQSYIKYFRVLLVALGGSTLINDLRVWKSGGAFGPFDTIISGGLTTSNAGPQPYATPTNLSQLASGFPNVPTADPGAQNLGIGGFNNNNTSKSMPTDTPPIPNSRSNYFAQQVTIDNGGTTANGNLSTKTYTVQYDES